eukprot:Rhum_TRINITY_DN14653_c11_g1::Rhum_TRINITY_DN14653_c11_g1_i1::g.106934::m.106934
MKAWTGYASTIAICISQLMSSAYCSTLPTPPHSAVSNSSTMPPARGSFFHISLLTSNAFASCDCSPVSADVHPLLPRAAGEELRRRDAGGVDDTTVGPSMRYALCGSSVSSAGVRGGGASPSRRLRRLRRGAEEGVLEAEVPAAAAAAAAAGVPSSRDAQRVQEAVEQLLCQQRPCGTTPATCPESASEAQQDMSLELAKARQEAEELRALLAAQQTQQTQQAQVSGQATRRQVSAATSPDARAALARLGQLGGHSPYISTAPASPMRFAAPDSVAAPPPALASPEPAAADPSVWSNGRHVRTVSPARRPPAGTLPAATLLPSTQEILKRVGATFSPEGAAALGTPTQTPPGLSAAGGVGTTASPAAFATSYHLGPIDPSTL